MKLYSTSMLNAAHFIVGQTGTPAYSEGQPGCGKSNWHNALANTLKLSYWQFCPEGHIPEDVPGSGVPKPSVYEDGETEVYKKLPWEAFHNVVTNPTKWLVLVDELTCVEQDMQSALQGFLCNPPEGLLIYAAGNPISQAANAHELRPSVVNRMWMGRWQTPWDDVFEGWDGGMVFPDPQIPVLPPNWRQFMDGVVPNIKRFLLECVDVREQDVPEEPMTPYASARSWTNTLLGLAAGYSVQANQQIRYEIMAGLVGTPIAQQYSAWESELALPEMAELATDHKMAVEYLSKASSADLLSCLGGLVNYTLQQMQGEEADAAWLNCQELFDKVAAKGRYEHVWLPYAKLRSNKPKDLNPTLCDLDRKVVASHQAVTQLTAED